MRRNLTALVLGTMSLLMASSAAADTATATIDDRSPSLAELDDGGWTADLAFANLTTEELSLTVTAADTGDQGCSLTLDSALLPPAERLDVTVSIPQGCEVGEEGIDFVISASGASGTSSIDFQITAASRPDPGDPEWRALWAFPILLAALIVLAGVLYLVWEASDAENHRINDPLKYLEASWSFKESWVSNVTVAAGLLTGVFGSSEVVKGILGEDSDRSIALATVGAAIAVAIVAAGPVVLLSTKRRVHETIDGVVQPATSHLSIYGLLLASAVTLSGAFGEIYVVVLSAADLDLGGLETKVWIAGVLAALLLLFYSARTMYETLESGTTVPPEPAPSDTMRAATLIASALRAEARGDTGLDDAIGELQGLYPTAPSTLTSPGDEQLPRRRTAVL